MSQPHIVTVTEYLNQQEGVQNYHPAIRQRLSEVKSISEQSRPRIVQENLDTNNRSDDSPGVRTPRRTSPILLAVHADAAHHLQKPPDTTIQTCRSGDSKLNFITSRA